MFWPLVIGVGVTVVGAAGVVHWRAGQRESAAEAAHPPQGSIVTVDGVPVHAVVTGAGPDVVLIHGAGGNTRDWTFDFAHRLADRYRVTIFDRPGLGWTGRARDYGGAWSRPAEPPLEQAALLQRAARQLGIERPVVVGHSFGGAVAFAWALSDDTTGAVVSVAGVANPWPGDLGWLYKVNSSPVGGALFVPLLTAFAPRAAIEDTIHSIFAPQPAPPGYVDHVAPGLTLRRHTLRANARQVNQLRPYIVEMSARYGELDLPVEVVHGDADDIVPLAIHSAPLPDQISGAQVTVLDGVGHMPHHVAPDAVVAAIDRAAARAGLR